MKYRKKPVVIEAIQATGTPESNREIIDWTRGSATPASMDEHPERGKTLSIATLEGAHWVSPDDWIIKGVKGEFYPCKPDIFAATYEPTGTEREQIDAQLVPGDGVNRIAELRALRQTERSAHGGDDLMPWASAADVLRGALYDDCDALLDCAKALRGLVDVAKDSLGIAGYHLNGEILEWDDVEELHAGMDALRRLSAGVSRSIR